jgi:CHAT domain-containing protein
MPPARTPKPNPLYQRLLAIKEKALGPEHLAVAAGLNNLAVLYRSTGQYAKAEPLFQRALAINEKALGSAHPDVALSLNNLAGLYQQTGAYAKAEPLYQWALTIWEKALGPEHPTVGVVLSNQAAMSIRGGGHQHASDLFVRIFGIEERQIHNVFAFTSEMDKLQFVQFLAGNLNGYLSLVHQHLGADRPAVHAALGVLLRRKGVVFEAQSRLQEARQGQLSGDARQDWQRLSALRGEYAGLTLHKPDNLTSEQYRETLASLQRDMDAVEQRLAKLSGLVAQERAQRKVTVEQVAKQLPMDGALVEFVKIRDFDFTKGQWNSSSRYLAFVLTAAGNVTLVDLGEADAVDHQADRTLEAIKVALMTRRKDHLLTSHESLAQLSALVWTPLANVIEKVDTIIVSPDGQLNLVPFAALVDRTGQPLVERYHVAYVSSGRELITTAAAFTPETELLLVANPAYDQTVPAASSSTTVLRSRDFRGHFDPLPGTEREAHEIPPLIAGPPAQKRVLVGSSATEGVVKAARSPRILHLATHGFFLQDKLIPLETALRGVHLKMGSPQGSPQMSSPIAAGPMDLTLGFPTRYENPLVRSGLALAGANHAGESTDGEDGILTALEITGMDLHGTELVVLSACDTALGTVQTGEGVFGLRRAFALAGAKNLLMSLWAVDDEVTADQMKAYYQNLRTLPPADALRQAQLETIRRLKARDGVANPGLWAPFILQGAHAFGP